jgi:hypothetical protein
MKPSFTCPHITNNFVDRLGVRYYVETCPGNFLTIQIDFAMLHQLYQIAVIQKALKFAISFLYNEDLYTRPTHHSLPLFGTYLMDVVQMWN